MESIEAITRQLTPLSPIKTSILKFAFILITAASLLGHIYDIARAAPSTSAEDAAITATLKNITTNPVPISKQPPLYLPSLDFEILYLQMELASVLELPEEVREDMLADFVVKEIFACNRPVAPEGSPDHKKALRPTLSDHKRRLIKEYVKGSVLVDHEKKELGEGLVKVLAATRLKCGSWRAPISSYGFWL